MSRTAVFVSRDAEQENRAALEQNKSVPVGYPGLGFEWFDRTAGSWPAVQPLFVRSLSKSTWVLQFCPGRGAAVRLSIDLIDLCFCGDVLDGCFGSWENKAKCRLKKVVVWSLTEATVGCPFWIRLVFNLTAGSWPALRPRFIISGDLGTRLLPMLD